MRLYLVVSEPIGETPAPALLKFYEWLRYLKKSGRIIDYFARREGAGIAAIMRLNFEADLDPLLADWRKRAPSEFRVEPLKDIKAAEIELSKRLL